MADVTISGTSDLTDTYMRSYGANLHLNFGGRDLLSMYRQPDNVRENALIKIATSALPEMGACTLFRWDYQYYYTQGPFEAATRTLRRVLVDWGEGTSNPSASNVAGAADWTDAKHGTTAWTSGGAESSGNDYFASESETKAQTASPTAGQAESWSMTGDGLSWIQGWSGGSLNNYGLLHWMETTPTTTAVGANLRSTEHSTGPWSVYIEYTEPAAAAGAIFFGANF